MGMVYIIPFMIGLGLKIFLLKDLNEIKSINSYLASDINKISNFNEIQTKVHVLYKTLKRLLFYKKLWFGSFTLYLYKWRYDFVSSHFWGQRKLQWNLEWLYNYESSIIYEFLKDLRSDLKLRLREQQQTLEQAKSEVEKLKQTPLAPPPHRGIRNRTQPSLRAPTDSSRPADCSVWGITEGTEKG